MLDYVLEFWQDGLNNIKIKDFMLYILISNPEKQFYPCFCYSTPL